MSTPIDTTPDLENTMRLTLEFAEMARSGGDVPVGAIVVQNNKIVGMGYNRRENQNLACAHAEIVAIQRANRNLNRWRLHDCQMFVSLEPCLMCAGAIYQARLEGVFFGASDPKAGAYGSLYSIHEDTRLNHRPKIVQGGILEKECSELLKNFFRKRRSKSL